MASKMMSNKNEIFTEKNQAFRSHVISAHKYKLCIYVRAKKCATTFEIGQSKLKFYGHQSYKEYKFKDKKYQQFK